jgi:hypothetical protein
MSEAKADLERIVDAVNRYIRSEFSGDDYEELVALVDEIETKYQIGEQRP